VSRRREPPLIREARAARHARSNAGVRRPSDPRRGSARVRPASRSRRRRHVTNEACSGCSTTIRVPWAINACQSWRERVRKKLGLADNRSTVGALAHLLSLIQCYYAKRQCPALNLNQLRAHSDAHPHRSGREMAHLHVRAYRPHARGQKVIDGVHGRGLHQADHDRRREHRHAPAAHVCRGFGIGDGQLRATGESWLQPRLHAPSSASLSTPSPAARQQIVQHEPALGPRPSIASWEST
jgi:hypothetical protein